MSIFKNVIKDVYRGTNTVVKDTGIDSVVKKGAKTFNKIGGSTVDNVGTALKKGAKTFNKVGGRTVDNLLKIEDNFANLLSSPYFIIGGIALVMIVLR